MNTTLRFFSLASLPKNVLMIGQAIFVPAPGLEHSNMIDQLRLLARKGSVVDAKSNIMPEHHIVMVADSEFLSWMLSETRLVKYLEPAAYQEMLFKGCFGKFGNVHVVTDAWLEPTKPKILSKGCARIVQLHAKDMEEFEITEESKKRQEDYIKQLFMSIPVLGSTNPALTEPLTVNGAKNA